MTDTQHHEASTAQDIEPETLARLPDFYAPRLSPDSSELAFFHDTSGRMELYTLALPDGEWTQWSESNVPRSLTAGLEWSADGEQIYFHRDQDGDEQHDIYALSRDGTAQPVIETDGQTHLAAVDPDGEFLVCASDHGGQMNLHRYDLADGKSTQLTEHTRPVWAFGVELSPDGDLLAYKTNEQQDPENSDVYIVETAGGEPDRLPFGESGAEAVPGDWFPDSDRLLVGDTSENMPRVGIYDRGEESVSWLSNGETVERPAGVSPDGNRVLATRTREAATVPVVYDVETGEDELLEIPEGVAAPVGGPQSGFVEQDRLLVSNQTGTRRSSLLAYDLEKSDQQTIIEPEYDGVDSSQFVEPEYISYESEDGLDIGALLYEQDTEDGPAVVKVHGGPAAQSKRGFDLYAQFLVSQGYTVLAPNYRGSTGRGHEFANRIRDDLGGMEQIDIRCGAEWLADRDAVDPDRIAVFGGSYGGYSAYCQLTMHPEPWAAGIAWIGMTDLLALYEESMPHFQSTLEDYLGDPDEDERFYRERSPVEHVENIEDPLYIIHGVNDPRCPISQARLFRDALEKEGLSRGEDGAFEYTELGEEGHGSTDAEQKVRAFELLSDFLDRRV